MKSIQANPGNTTGIYPTYYIYRGNVRTQVVTALDVEAFLAHDASFRYVFPTLP
jgi:hypothetical protein